MIARVEMKGEIGWSGGLKKKGVLFFLYFSLALVIRFISFPSRYITLFRLKYFL